MVYLNLFKSGIKDNSFQLFRKKNRQSIEVREIRIIGSDPASTSKVSLPKSDSYYTQTIEYLHSQVWDPAVYYFNY